MTKVLKAADVMTEDEELMTRGEHIGVGLISEVSAQSFITHW